jgi:hypothetical protein
MVRRWRGQAGWLLLAFMVLDGLTLAYTRTAGASLNTGQPMGEQLIWLALDAFLVWRIWRRGSIAWTVLLILTASQLILILVGAIWPYPPYLVGLLAVIAAQAALLLSPAVRGHVRGRTL